MNHSEALDVVRFYGLDLALTEQDDVMLWATVLRQYWPASNRETLPYARRFAVLQLPDDPNDPQCFSSYDSLSGLRELEVWRFERNRMGFLQARRRRKESEPLLPRDYLDVTRPSAEENVALVHHGLQAGELAGSGEVARWERAPDGSWSQVGEPITDWIS